MAEDADIDLLNPADYDAIDLSGDDNISLRHRVVCAASSDFFPKAHTIQTPMLLELYRFILSARLESESNRFQQMFEKSIQCLQTARARIDQLYTETCAMLPDILPKSRTTTFSNNTLSVPILLEVAHSKLTKAIEVRIDGVNWLRAAIEVDFNGWFQQLRTLVNDNFNAPMLAHDIQNTVVHAIDQYDAHGVMMYERFTKTQENNVRQSKNLDGCIMEARQLIRTARYAAKHCHQYAYPRPPPVVDLVFNKAMSMTILEDAVRPELIIKDGCNEISMFIRALINVELP